MMATCSCAGMHSCSFLSEIVVFHQHSNLSLHIFVRSLCVHQVQELLFLQWSLFNCFCYQHSRFLLQIMSCHVFPYASTRYTALMAILPQPPNLDAFGGMAVGSVIGGMLAQVTFLPMMGAGLPSALASSLALAARCSSRLLAAHFCCGWGHRVIISACKAVARLLQQARAGQQQPALAAAAAGGGGGGLAAGGGGVEVRRRPPVAARLWEV
jgi:hypothetical protein